MTVASIWPAQNHHSATLSTGWNSCTKNLFPSRRLFGYFSDKTFPIRLSC